MIFPDSEDKPGLVPESDVSSASEASSTLLQSSDEFEFRSECRSIRIPGRVDEADARFVPLHEEAGLRSKLMEEDLSKTATAAAVEEAQEEDKGLVSDSDVSSSSEVTRPRSASLRFPICEAFKRSVSLEDEASSNIRSELKEEEELSERQRQELVARSKATPLEEPQEELSTVSESDVSPPLFQHRPSTASLDEFEYLSELHNRLPICEAAKRSLSLDEAGIRLELLEQELSEHLRQERVASALSAAVEESQELVKPKRKQVSWGTLEMRKFPIIPGLHPDCICGPPLTVDWECCIVEKSTIDDFEAERRPRRKTDDLKLSWLERRRILRRLGFKDDEMYKVQEESERLRKQRERTISRLKFSRVEEVQQTILRRLGRTMHPKKKEVLETLY